MFQTVKTRLALIPAAALVGAAQVHAAVPSEVTDALGEMKTDALAVAALVLVAIIAVAAFKFMRKGF